MSGYLSYSGSSGGGSGSTQSNLFSTGSTNITTDTTFSNTSFIDVLSATVDTSLATSSTFLMIWANSDGTITSGTGSFNWRITIDGVSVAEVGQASSKTINCRSTLSVGVHILKLQIQSTLTGGTVSIRPQTQPAESCWMIWQVSYT